MQTYSEFCKRLANDFNTFFNGEKRFTALDFRKDLIGTIEIAFKELKVSQSKVKNFKKKYSLVLNRTLENFDNGEIYQEDLESFYRAIQNILSWKN